ncbi:helix-turn-helix domain-containing protein [Cohnella caldifontis]|uniref:helix-turn-helix domain-containing protein n=1 Tax=Cohnella caldifontis TaxID=3027471 RepID=UPI0023EB536F|nr:helix-turn-helix domain-containing protein [Cohnella sp. YIM B05605]
MAAYKALIVDDEPIIRYGLASTVDWKGAGIELAGEAGNGEAALGLVIEKEVDILITDIKMPVMDGLELIRLARRSRPHLKAILISSYSDFEYARQAVQLGAVVDYLLKPTMEPEDVTRLLEECRRRLDGERSLEEHSALYAREEKKRERHLLETEMQRALSGQPAELPRYAGEFPGPYVLSIWRWNVAGVGREPERRTRKLAELFPEGALCAINERELALLLPDGAEGNSAGMAGARVREAHSALLAAETGGQDGSRVTVGISPLFHDLGRLPDAYSWAERAFARAFFEGIGGCYDGEIARNPASVSGDAADAGAEAREQAAALRERFSRKLAESDAAACERTLGQIFELWRSRTIAPDDIRKLAGDLLLRIATSRHFLKAEERLELLMEENEKLRQAESLEDVIAIVSSRFRQGADLRGAPALPASPDPSGGTQAIQSAILYIQEHYRSELSLQEVADSVHMSRNYFSETFKRRVGLNFIDYVIRLRIRYARHLLETTTLKVFDVGIQCGFNSAKHFLKMFKRETGCTPVEYRIRARKGEGGEG